MFGLIERNVRSLPTSKTGELYPETALDLLLNRSGVGTLPNTDNFPPG